MTQKKTWFDPRCTVLDVPYGARFVELSDGGLLGVEDNTTMVSHDDGRTWEDRGPVYTGPKPGIPSGGPMIKTEDGAIVLVYTDKSTFKSTVAPWDIATGKGPEDARNDVWTIRSLDEGETWQDRHRILEGYCGAIINIIQMRRNGPIIVPVQEWWNDPDRNVQATYASNDNGKTWTRSNVIDLGGNGHHDGGCEGAVIELMDRQLWMLIRTSWDCFWEAYSMDEGLSWRIIQPTDIDASSAPAYLQRLSSGRIVLVWNRLYPEGRDTYQRRSGAYSQDWASWHREELSIAFSDDDGKTWTDPEVLISDEGGATYPWVCERRPGEIWVKAAGVSVSLKESDWVS